MTVIYDIETLLPLFTYSDIDINTKEVHQFMIHDSKDEFKRLLQHLMSLKGMIGYNNIAFDYPVLHYMIVNQDHLNSLGTRDKISAIYNEAQRIIRESDNSTFSISPIPYKQWIIPQLDLYKIWHYNNNGRRTSLKALEVSMNYPNVMDMPIPHFTEKVSLIEANEVLEYNLNDVMATLAFYEKSKDKIDLRRIIRAKYGLECMNWNNGKIGEELILKLYSDKIKANKWDIKKLRTHRKHINLADCVPDIVFHTNEFNSIIDYFKSKTVTETKGSIQKSLIYKGLKYDYGTGGLHACVRAGVYESDNEHIIKSCDVASLYPNIPIAYNFYIEHLGPEFLEVYKQDIVDVRLAEKAKPKAEQDKTIIDGYKEAANVPYGKSNSNDSFLYDPLYTMKTTIHGQIVMSKLCELLSRIPNSQILMVNTDGLEIKIHRKYENTYMRFCKYWQIETCLTLEFDEYQKMWIGDINNYGAMTLSGKIKSKGRFEVDKIIGSEPAYHKDNSFRIVPLALQEYFSKEIAVEETISKHHDIYDFCGRQKFNKDSQGITKTVIDNNIIKHKQQKVVRYFISNKGSIFIKQYKKDNSTEFINKGYLVTIFNKYMDLPFDDYNINYQFYINECYKEINNIIKRQMVLF